MTGVQTCALPIFLGAEVAQLLRARGAPPSAIRLTGHEHEVEALAEALTGLAVSSADESSAATLGARGVQQLVAAGPFLRALRRAAPAALWNKLQAFSDEQGATLEQAASRHQRLLRDLTPEQQDRLEALCHFEAAELLRKVGAARTGTRIAARVAHFISREE